MIGPDGIYHGPICLPIPLNTVYVKIGNQEFFFSATFTVVNPFVYFTEDEYRPIGSLLSLGVPGLSKFNGCLPFLGSSWHVSTVRQCAMLNA